jgi:hypothetical protein
MHIAHLARTENELLDRFIACLVQNTYAIVLLDQAGWHREKALAVPVGGAIHSIKSGRISLPREASLKVV